MHTIAVASALLDVLTECPDEKTVEFHIPSKASGDHRGRVTGYRIVWIHPKHNPEFCHYLHDSRGDLPNFYVEVCKSDGPSEILDDLETEDDLSYWLEEFQPTSV